jgi:hypothetical protein
MTQNSSHYCKHCLHGFPSQQKLGEHLQNGCRAITEARPVLPEPGSKEACVEFKNHDKQYKAPFVVYADFEALTRPVSKAERKGNDSYTDAYQTHEPCGFCVHIVSADPARTFEPVVYRGPNTIKEFILKMKEIEQMLMPLIKAVEPIQMSTQDEREFKCAKTCCLCHKALDKDRVREHDHLTGTVLEHRCSTMPSPARTHHFPRRQMPPPTYLVAPHIHARRPCSRSKPHRRRTEALAAVRHRPAAAPPPAGAQYRWHG